MRTNATRSEYVAHADISAALPIVGRTFADPAPRRAAIRADRGMRLLASAICWLTYCAVIAVALSVAGCGGGEPADACHDGAPIVRGQCGPDQTIPPAPTREASQ